MIITFINTVSFISIFVATTSIHHLGKYVQKEHIRKKKKSINKTLQRILAAIAFENQEFLNKINDASKPLLENNYLRKIMRKTKSHLQ